MDRNKKSAPVVATPGQQMEMEFFSQSPHSFVQSSTYQGPVSRFLSSGQPNAVPLKHLEMVTGWDGRTIRRSIEDERRAGVPILADNFSGYYLASTEEEKAACVRSMRHRAAEILKTAACMERGEIQNGGARL